MRPAMTLLLAVLVVAGGIYFDRAHESIPNEYRPLLNAMHSCSPTPTATETPGARSTRISCELEVCTTMQPLCDRYATWETAKTGRAEARLDNAREDARPY